MNNRILLSMTVYIAALWLGLPVLASERGEGRALDNYSQAVGQLAADLNKRQGDVFLKMLDQEALLASVFKAQEFSAKEKNAYSEMLRTVFNKLPEEIVSKIPPNGYAKVLRAKPLPQGAKVLMRVDFGNLGYAYYDFLVNQDQKGNYRITDWFNYGVGQYYSESLQQLIALSRPSAGNLGRLFDAMSGRKQNLEKIEAFMQSLGKKEFDQAYAQYRAFPADLKKNRILMVIVVQTANLAQNNEFYHAALADLAANFADDTELAFLLMDYYFLEQRYADAVRIIDNLQQGFGVRDAALLGMKANALITGGKVKEGLRVAGEATRLEPELENNYWVWLNANVLAKDHVTAVKVAQTLEKNFGYDITAQALSQDEMYSDFIKSAAFRNWKK